MLDRTSKNILRAIVHETPNMKDGLFTWDYVAKICGLSKDEVFDCIRFLDEKGLLRCVYIDFLENGKNNALLGFAPNHKGRHYTEFARIEFWETILKSVLLPVIVAVITALLVSA